MDRTYEAAFKARQFGHVLPEGKREQLQIRHLTAWMDECGYKVRHNTITAKAEVDALSPTGREMSLQDLITSLVSDLRPHYGGVAANQVHDYIVYIAMEEQYNPVLDYLDTLVWDGEDHIEGLYDLMGIKEESPNRILVRKWLYQTIALLYNKKRNPYGAEGVLVLLGPQGCGKSSLFARLALRPEWFGSGLSLNKFDKDTTRRAITTWITELGELETTFRKTDEDLRNFVTQTYDRYRLPYGRTDVEEPRHTSLCATANARELLVDEEGNRRWWVVELDKYMSYEEIQAFPAEQLWAQVYDEVSVMTERDKQNCFRLTTEERATLNRQNEQYRTKLPAQQELEDIFSDIEASDMKAEEIVMSSTEIRNRYLDILRAYNAATIGKALKRLGYEYHRVGNKRGYKVPMPKSSIHLPF